MPWNDNANPGPWGSPPPQGDDDRPPPRKPGGPNRGAPNRPDRPDLGDFGERLSAWLGGIFGGGGRGVQPGALVGIVGVAVGLWALSGFYVIQPNEAGVVTTFGAYSRTESPGLRYHIPAPIEGVQKVAVTSLQRTDIGGVAGAEVPGESLMLTGDENIVDLNFSVTWRIADPARYLFTIDNPENAVKAIAESAMREVVGKSEFAALQNTNRGRAQTETAELMQKALDAWGAGVSVVEVQIRNVNPPAEVKPAARDVQSALQDAESAKNEANAYLNRVVPEARGEAARITQSALAYKEQAVREATGDAARFTQILDEYRRAPGVTRDRLYIETMQRVLSRSNKVIVDAKGASAPIILPPDAFKPRAASEAAIRGLQPAAPTPQAQTTTAPQQGAAR